jgi:hypothetical protein
MCIAVRRSFLNYRASKPFATEVTEDTENGKNRIFDVNMSGQLTRLTSPFLQRTRQGNV